MGHKNFRATVMPPIPIMVKEVHYQVKHFFYLVGPLLKYIIVEIFLDLL